MRDKIDILELNRDDFENSRVKNDFIKKTEKEWIGFANAAEVSGAELAQILKGGNFLDGGDVIVFGENIPAQGDLFSVIEAVGMGVFALVFKRSIMERIGCFNELLLGGTNYEFLCRAACENFWMCLVPCASENGGRENAGPGAETLAYVLKKYMIKLKSAGELDAVFGKVITYCEATNQADELNQVLGEFLNGGARFEVLEKNTAPFYMIMGDDTCNGVLRDFAVQLLEGLVSLGQAVATSQGDRGCLISMSEIDKRPLKGIVGFQAPVLENVFFQAMNVKKFQFWFDNPAFFSGMFKGDDNYYLLCQDKFYADHITKYYGLKNAMQFPPAGKSGDYFCMDNKSLDVVFIGTYNKPDYGHMDEEFKQAFFNYMISKPKLTFEEGLAGILAGNQLLNDTDKCRQLLNMLANVCRTVINFYREKIVEIILAAGIKLHVYGDSWNRFEGAGKENLIIHPAITPEESMEVMSRAKISLNVMTWHKAGMTERIANSMLAGAVCLSDETVYLRENFSEDEIVLFELEHLEKLPEKIVGILEDDDLRRKIAENAYRKAMEEHTWRRRAEELLELAKE